VQQRHKLHTILSKKDNIHIGELVGRQRLAFEASKVLRKY
jgi:hypothetical protein